MTLLGRLRRLRRDGLRYPLPAAGLSGGNPQFLAAPPPAETAARTFRTLTRQPLPSSYPRPRDPPSVQAPRRIVIVL